MTQLSSFFLGTWQFEDVDQRTAHALVETAHDVGITHFDTAAVYAGGLAESILGRTICPGDIVLTKVPAVDRRTTSGSAAYPRAHVEGSIEQSIRRLGRPPDVVLLHNWHAEWQVEHFAPLAELRVIADRVGVASIGISLPNGHDGRVMSSPVLDQIDFLETPFNAGTPLVRIEDLATLGERVQVLARSLLLHGRDVSAMHKKFSRVISAGCAPVVGASTTQQIRAWR